MDTNYQTAIKAIGCASFLDSIEQGQKESTEYLEDFETALIENGVIKLIQKEIGNTLGWRHIVTNDDKVIIFGNVIEFLFRCAEWLQEKEK